MSVQFRINQTIIALTFTLASLVGGLALPVAGDDPDQAKPMLADSGPTPEGGTGSEDHEQLVFLHDSGPVFLRLNIWVGGKNYRKVWREYTDRMFADLDQDDNGKLEAAEITAIPSRQQLALLGFRVVGSATPPRGPVLPDDLFRYFNVTTGGPFQLNEGPVPSNRRFVLVGAGRSDGAETGLFERMDRNGDRKLAPDELGLTPWLRKFDRDDDETVSPAELQPVSSGPYAYVNPSARIAIPTQFIHVTASTTTLDSVARRIISHYDKATTHQQGKDGAAKSPTTAQREKDHQLTKDEIGWDAKKFRQADRDGDGRLNRNEVVALVRNAPQQIQCDLRLGEKEEFQRNAAVRLPKGSPLAAGLRQVDEKAVLKLGRVQIEFASGAARSNVRISFPTDDSGKRLFELADTDNNEYIDEREARRRPPFNMQFKTMDADNDKKVFLSEFLAYQKRTAAAAKVRTELTVTNQGNKLFEILDTNNDKRLNDRELRAAGAKIAAWDTNGDGHIAKVEIPRTWRLTLAHGSSQQRLAVAVFYGGPQQAPRRKDTDAPRWFQKMDRNGDGEITQREFLLGPQRFARLDNDSNGVIDADEAAALK